MTTIVIIKCLKIIEQMNLKGKEIVEDFTIAKIERIYNGIGPDRFPDWLRDIVTMANGLFEPAAMIHDLRYHIGGTKADFTAANDEFRENCYTLVKAAYAWYDPRRYKWLFRAWRYAGYCQEFGWSGFHKIGEKCECSACANYTEKTEKTENTESAEDKATSEAAEAEKEVAEAEKCAGCENCTCGKHEPETGPTVKKKKKSKKKGKK